MIIMYNMGIVMAKAVLNQVELIVRKENLDKQYYVECYQNGREQGYIIMNQENSNLFEKVIYITKQRNTDKLVLYIGLYSNQGLSQNAYDNMIEFNDDEEYKAAQYIIENL